MVEKSINLRASDTKWKVRQHKSSREPRAVITTQTDEKLQFRKEQVPFQKQVSSPIGGSNHQMGPHRFLRTCS